MLDRVGIHVPLSASNAPVNASQDTICFCVCSGALLNYVQFVVVYMASQVTFATAVPQPHRYVPNSYWVPTLPVYPGLSLRWLSLSHHQVLTLCHQRTW